MFTLKTYAHLFENSKREAMDKIEHIVTEFKAKITICEKYCEMPLCRYKKATGVKARGCFIITGRSDRI